MNFRFIKRLLIILFVLAFIYVVVDKTNLFKRGYSTYPARIDTISLEMNKKVFIFRNETIISSSKSGDIEFLVEDGKRVAYGTPIAKIKVKDIKEDKKSKKNDIDYNKCLIDLTSINSKLEGLSTKIRHAVKMENFSETGDITEKQSKIIPIKIAANQNNDRIVLNNSVNSQRSVDNDLIITAASSGIVSLETGEDDILFSYLNRVLIKDSCLKDDKLRGVKTSVRSGEPFIRIVNNTRTYLSVILDENELESFNIGDTIDISIANTVVKASVEYLINLKDKKNVIFVVEEKFENDHKFRALNAILIPKKSKGLIIKNSSIVEEKGELGVYVLRTDESKEFVPIKIKVRVGNDVSVYSDYFMITEEGKEKSVKTLKLYDEIVEKP